MTKDKSFMRQNLLCSDTARGRQEAQTANPTRTQGLGIRHEVSRHVAYTLRNFGLYVIGIYTPRLRAYWADILTGCVRVAGLRVTVC